MGQVKKPGSGKSAEQLSFNRSPSNLLMAPVQKIKVVIEVELQEREQLLGGALNLPGDSASSTEDLQHQRALFTALREDPDRHIEFVKAAIVGSLETYEINRMIATLAQLDSPYTAGLDVLEKLFPRLPSSTQQHFQRAMQEGWISEGTIEVFDAIHVRPVTLTVEYPAKPS